MGEPKFSPENPKIFPEAKNWIFKDTGTQKVTNFKVHEKNKSLNTYKRQSPRKGNFEWYKLQNPRKGEKLEMMLTSKSKKEQKLGKHTNIKIQEKRRKPINEQKLEIQSKSSFF